MRRSVIAVTTIVLAALAAPAWADPPEKVQIRIQVTPADLESRETVAQLYQRVDEAAASVCREIMGGSFAPGTDRYSSPASCRRALIRDALADTPIQPLARYYAELRGARTGTELASR